MKLHNSKNVANLEYFLSLPRYYTYQNEDAYKTLWNRIFIQYNAPNGGNVCNKLNLALREKLLSKDYRRNEIRKNSIVSHIDYNYSSNRYLSRRNRNRK